MSNGDRKYNRAAYTGLGKDMQDRLIEGAYMSARAELTTIKLTITHKI
jgi:hypothetical protein